MTQLSNVEARFDSSGVESFQGKLENHQKLYDERFTNMMRLLDWKGDRDDFEKSEKKMKAYVDEQVNAIDRFADKDEVMKKLL